MAQAWRLGHATERTLSSYDALEEAVLREAFPWDEGAEPLDVTLDALETAPLVGPDLAGLLEVGPPGQRPPPQQPSTSPPQGQGMCSTSVPQWAALPYSPATFSEAWHNPTTQLPPVQGSQDGAVQPPALHVPPAPSHQGQIPDASSGHGSGKTVGSRQYSTSSPESITLQRLQDAAGGRAALPGRPLAFPTASAAASQVPPALPLPPSSQQQQQEPRLEQQGVNQAESESYLQYKALLLRYWRLKAQLHQKQQAAAAAASHSRLVGIDTEGFLSMSSGLEQQHSQQQQDQPLLPALPLSEPVAVGVGQRQLDRSISAPAGVPAASASDASVLLQKRRMSAPHPAAYSQQAGQPWQREEDERQHHQQQPASAGMPPPVWRQARYFGSGYPSLPCQPAEAGGEKEQEEEDKEEGEEEEEAAPAAWPGPWHKRSSANRSGSQPSKRSQAHPQPLPGGQLSHSPMTRPGSSGASYKWVDGHSLQGPVALQPPAGGALPAAAVPTALGMGEVAGPQASARQQPPRPPTSQASMDPRDKKERRNSFRDELSRSEAFRERERERARRSRQRKQEHVRHLEQQNTQLRREVRRLQQVLRAWATQGFVTPEQAQEFLGSLAAYQDHAAGQG